jgi:hypothetical protein
MLMMASVANAAVIEEFGFVVGKVLSPDPTHLLHTQIISTNPPVPLVYDPVSIDVSGWSANGDSIDVSPVHIKGFDLPFQEIVLDLDCTLDQALFLGVPTGVIACDVANITHVENPSVLGTEIVLDTDTLVITQQGAIVDALGMASTPMLATASGTGTKGFLVPEPSNFAAALGFLAGILLIGIARLPSVMRE